MNIPDEHIQELALILNANTPEEYRQYPASKYFGNARTLIHLFQENKKDLETSRTPEEKAEILEKIIEDYTGEILARSSSNSDITHVPYNKLFPTLQALIKEHVLQAYKFMQKNRFLKEFNTHVQGLSEILYNSSENESRKASPLDYRDNAIALLEVFRKHRSIEPDAKTQDQITRKYAEKILSRGNIFRTKTVVTFDHLRPQAQDNIRTHVAAALNYMDAKGLLSPNIPEESRYMEGILVSSRVHKI